jgi:hypothetical protein
VAENSNKKVVRVEETAAEKKAGSSAPTWTPTAQSKGKATSFRLIAALLWVVAIGAEAFDIFWVLRRPQENGAFPTWAFILLIGIAVGIALLSIGGSLLWKQANRLDPASKSEPVRFFVQNQLGAIIAVIAFLPLILLIFFDKNLSGQQKGIAGAAGIVLFLVAGFFGTSINPPSTEQYASETQQVTDATGQNLVYWTKAGKVFHLCSDASAVNLTSKDNTIYSGTVDEAHAAGKSRLTLQVEQERKQCGFDATPAPSPSN